MTGMNVARSRISKILVSTLSSLRFSDFFAVFAIDQQRRNRGFNNVADNLPQTPVLRLKLTIALGEIYELRGQRVFGGWFAAHLDLQIGAPLNGWGPSSGWATARGNGGAAAVSV